MTLENCERLLEHYERQAEGEGIARNNKHKHLVMKNAKIAAEQMRGKIKRKMTLPKYKVQEIKPEVKTDGEE